MGLLMCVSRLCCFEVTGECYLPQGVTEARLKKWEHNLFNHILSDVGFVEGSEASALWEDRHDGVCVSVVCQSAYRCEVCVCVCVAVVRLNCQASHANKKSHVGAYIEEGSPLKCICASE